MPYFFTVSTCAGILAESLVLSKLLLAVTAEPPVLDDESEPPACALPPLRPHAVKAIAPHSSRVAIILFMVSCLLMNRAIYCRFRKRGLCLRHRFCLRYRFYL